MKSLQNSNDSQPSLIDIKLWRCLTGLVSNNSRWIGSVPKAAELCPNPPLSETILDTSHKPSVGCVRGNTNGMCKFLNGNCYEGEFRNGKMEGVGRYLWTDGNSYEGQVLGNRIEGCGTYKWTDGTEYTGQVRNGLRDGSGVFRLGEGQYYDGDWREGKMQGVGKMVFESDEEGNPVSYYEGEFVKNRREGTGVRVYRSGNVYTGGWLRNLSHGRGRMEWRDKGEVYIGEWFEGVQNGYGEMLWDTDLVNSAQFPNKNRYVGSWRDGQRNGQGVLYYATGAVYSGSWVSDRKEGAGVFIDSNGDRVEGEFRDDKLVCANEQPETRPLTPVSQLVGDVDESDSCHRSEAFKISLLHLIPETLNPEIELRAVHNVLLTNIGELKWIFHFYSKLGVPPGSPHSFTRLKLWQMLADCQIFYKETFREVDMLFSRPLPDKHTPQLLHHPGVDFLLREFLQCLVVLGFHLFSKLYAGEPGRLAWCLKYIIEDTLLPNACSGTGYLYQTPEMLLITEPYFAPCYKLYNSVCKDGTVCYRSLLHLLSDCKCLEVVPVEAVFGFINNTNPFFYQEECYKAMLAMNFLEFFNILLSCAKLTGPNESARLFEQMSKQEASDNDIAGGDRVGSMHQSGGSREDRNGSSQLQSEANSAGSELVADQLITSQPQDSPEFEDNSSKEQSQVNMIPAGDPDPLAVPASNRPLSAGEDVPVVPEVEPEAARWKRQLRTFFAETLFPEATVAFQSFKL